MQYLVIIPEEHGKLADAVKELHLGLGVPHRNLFSNNNPPKDLKKWRDDIRSLATEGFSGHYLQAKTSVRDAANEYSAYIQEFNHVFVMDYHPIDDDRSVLTVIKTRNPKLRQGDSFTVDINSPRTSLLSMLEE